MTKKEEKRNLTSKDCLVHIINELAIAQTNGRIIAGLPSEQDLIINNFCIQQITNDLEILEILKPFVKAVIELKGQNINVLDFHISDSAKTKIKEWLENEKV